MMGKTSEIDQRLGTVLRIAGPVVGAVGLDNVRLYDMVQVGEYGLIGEVIRLQGERVTIQVYEDTSGVRVGEPVRSTGMPLVAELGPGLLGQVYDGLQRPLAELAARSGDFLARGLAVPSLSETKRWSFTPRLRIGDAVSAGDVLGSVTESRAIIHRIMVPFDVQGRLVDIRNGEFGVNDTVAIIEVDQSTDSLRSEDGTGHLEVTLAQHWPVRRPRPVRARLDPHEPLITGTRIIDTFFPVAKGGSAIIPGGFGTGKTVVEQSLARWAAVDVVVYVGCGERGNEMTEVLEEFPQLEDPRSGVPLMERTILIANTSNMPVAAREASIYTGVTIAEYYRDMGYDVLMLADSTSRWGEALREISGRLEEMPGEEGYPAYLGTRLSEFYERSGRVVCLGRAESQTAHTGPPDPRSGSVTVVGAVSPPGGDFSEPVTQSSMRVVGTFWALDYDLSRRRHFPAINWLNSYSLYNFGEWYTKQVASDWESLTRDAMLLLQREAELLEIVQLVGPDTLSETERAVLFVAKMLREDFLHQSSYHDVDRFCPIGKGYWMLAAVMEFYRRTREALEAGMALADITALPVVADIARMKELPAADAVDRLRALVERLDQQFRQGKARSA